MKRLIIDLDHTISVTTDGDYRNARPVEGVVSRIKEYKALGFDIVINTSRNVRTYQGNVGKIAANTLPIIVDWLKEHDIPFDEIYVGKPWCGHEGFYVDDRAIRPSEFFNMSREEVSELLAKEKDAVELV
ncbi:capsular biosynthesis protein [Microbulbifer hydrolyticus]|uniref:Capsular biosynthesis protein n=1 Tax=Microbulbifer hydrolyticus TaxID=48074 RepID=A0A6P1TB15_9GAMM|nr:capsular biosynthesis protein [Microbulbifer hydrolyticus]MBB5212307.1 capsule biosynthesis phosphatase [Microbulbifer hydrolyticus]QHQ39954.1 capsular biosynthesis protein [Microbulbifer hydrolyticus]